MSGAHAFLPPSGAPAWSICALWPRMNAAYPETGEKLEAKQGTAAHWVFERLLYSQPVTIGETAPNGITVGEEMLDGAELYCAVVTEEYAKCGAVSHYRIETRVQIPEVHANNWGTPDTWIFGHNATTGRARLAVIDYKFGHDFIEVFENMQLVDYVCGILTELEIDGTADQLLDVEFVVVQPRSYGRGGPVRRWSTRASNLRALFNRLRSAAEDAHAPEPKATPSPDACKHCPGRHACEALQRQGYALPTLAGMSTPIDLPPDAMGLELKMLESAIALAQARASGLAEQLEHSLARGERNRHYELSSTPGRLGWNRPDYEVLALGSLLGADLAKPAEPITPTQAMKKIDPAMVEAFASRPAGALKLSPISTVSSRKAFS